MRPKLAALLPVLLLLATAPGSLAAAPLDVVLALDRSLSMYTNDPSRRTIEGARLFSTLLGADDRLAIMTFAQDARWLMPLTRLADPSQAARASDLVQAIEMNGLQTNFEVALRAALEALSNARSGSGARPILVLFSDGQLNLGNEQATEAARALLVDELIPRLKAAGIQVYGIALSSEADLPFLAALSESTGGIAFRADTPDAIYAAFLKLFEQTDQPLMVPMVEGAVRVDAMVDALKLIVPQTPGGESVQLIDPSNRRIRADDGASGVDWQSAPGYDQITIRHPDPGAWTLAGGDQDHDAYIDSDLGLSTGVPVLAEVSELVEVSARLTRQGAPLGSDLLESVRFEAVITDERGSVVDRIGLQPDAGDPSGQRHRGAFNLSASGIYPVRITARGSGFERSKTSYISIVTSRRSSLSAPSSADGGEDSASSAASSASALGAPRNSALVTVLLANLVVAALAGLGIGIWRWRKGRDEPEGSEASE